jgi:hypothetical protein
MSKIKLSIEQLNGRELAQMQYQTEKRQQQGNHHHYERTDRKNTEDSK